MLLSSLYALAVSFSTASAVYQGFNYGSTYTDGSAISQSEYETLFTTAQNLVGHSGFTSARLYTMVQAGTTDGVISAIPAAINTKTTLLLGMWASAGQADFDNELSALKSAISSYGSSLTELLAGISVGSEDLYRISPTGIENKSGAGASPAAIVDYINQVRTAISGTAVSSALIGHVDTWTAWVNGSNDAVIDSCDFIGMDAYPYFQTTEDNGINVSNTTFFDAYDVTVAASAGKPVWITETGWPVSGPTENLAVPSIANAKTYWDEVACTVLGNINTFWYTLQDAYPTTPSPSFGLVGSDLSTTPLYDLTCPGDSSSSSSSTSSISASTASSTATEATFSASSASLVSTDTTIVGTGSATSVQSSTTVTSNAPATTDSTDPATTKSTATATAESTTSAPPRYSVSVTTFVTKTSHLITSTGEATTIVITSTDEVTVTSCSGGCSKDTATETFPAETSPAETSAAETSAAALAGTTAVKTSASATSSTTATAVATSACTTDILSGDYQYPHLIIPVSSVEPTKAFGTSYFGEVSDEVSSVFNFDIPETYAGKTCTIVFLFPTQAQLETSSYTISGEGGFEIKELSAPATVETTYDTVPAAAGIDITLESVAPGNSYVIASHSCGAGERISFEVSATGSLNLQYFQDYSPSPIGLYISAC